MKSKLRLAEYKVLLYRLFLGYLFYFIARVLFFTFNTHLFAVDSFWALLKLCYYGMAFDTTALLYINSLFILLSVLPLTVNTRPGFQKGMAILYFVTNLLAYATNFVDIIYYRFSQVRSTRATLDVLADENNKKLLFTHFSEAYWYVIIIFILCSLCWIWLYNRVKLTPAAARDKKVYFLSSIMSFLLILALVIGGIRGDFAHSTRPINMVDAYKHITVPNQGDIVLNTSFAIFRTLGTNNYKLQHWTDEAYIKTNIKPIKQYNTKPANKPNVVIIILESMAREYWGSMNRDVNIPGFKSYTPFLDSISGSSLIFTNAYATGRQSIHAMSSVLAGIPSFQNAFTSSPYAKQQIQSIVSVCDSMGYQTSFFHGAANGSMGFQGFGSILGYQHYYGRTEYNDDKDFDGIWGIWDEYFFQFMGRTLSNQTQPFMATLFTLSSHDPYQLPEKYKARFKGGPLAIDKCVQYTDNSLRIFFNYAKTQPWFNNTIFVITADHTSQTYYPEYSKQVNRFAVPILFYSANSAYNLKGVRTDLASQMDIYPTVADLIGYNKPFRSWGRSLVGNYPDEQPRVINSTGNIYQFMQGNYTYLFDGKNFTGIFAVADKGLEKNLMTAQPNAEMQKGMQDCKALIQDYTDRIVNGKLLAK
ncbi:sulfatase-like hydrolase/transferase [Mucilaginibacter gossypii]|uniref:LTA synthase family protein n=1 Tax=Mucilaginibacter gossypii TaxID=551996 RepID=UPI000DCE9EC6|nr:MULTISPECIES: alkaline phosphatase family protein [Mucilaginibacter]QTE39376.1 sulfatase-like hydrolase/transferase [Mucilaginibacter gossypii]RAV56259.1 LTA synthase family protein [Mucilaginibacter rubeus]